MRQCYKPAMSDYRIGIIGGTGLYDIEGFTGQKWVKVRTPFGPPSDDLLTGKLAGRDVIFLPRHGRGHRILPSELNHRANSRLRTPFLAAASWRTSRLRIPFARNCGKFS